MTSRRSAQLGSAIFAMCIISGESFTHFYRRVLGSQQLLGEPRSCCETIVLRLSVCVCLSVCLSIRDDFKVA